MAERPMQGPGHRNPAKGTAEKAKNFFKKII